MSKDTRAGCPSRPLALDGETDRLLISNIRDVAIILIDSEGRIAGWHAGAAHLYGYSSDEAVGEHISRFFTPEANERGWPQQVLARGPGGLRRSRGSARVGDSPTR